MKKWLTEDFLYKVFGFMMFGAIIAGIIFDTEY